MADIILRAMKKIASNRLTEFSWYGSRVGKQAYIYSSLQQSPSELGRNCGMTWGIGAYFVPLVLETLGGQVRREMELRVLRDIKTVFASEYCATIGLADLLDPDQIARMMQGATGKKYLVVPT